MKKLLVRNLMYLYTSVFTAGMRNIVTQMFFDKYYPDNKETLVSIALFFSALFTTFGIFASSRVNNKECRKGTKILIVAGMTAAVSVSFASMFLVENLVLYILCFSVSSFCINYMYNVFDVFISATVAFEEREHNVRVLLSYQMAGFIAGPIFFSYFAAKPWLCIAFTLAAQLVGYVYVGVDYIKHKGQNAVKKDKTEKKADTADKTVKRNDRKVMIYCFLMFCSTNILMPSIAYIMKDYLNVNGYALKSSLFLAAVVAASAIVILFISSKKLWRMRYIPPVAMGAALLLILLMRKSDLLTLGTAAVISGCGYGMFLSGSRYYVNAAETERDLVHRYNKVMTESTLIGYIISAAASWICVNAGIQVIPVKLTIILIMFALALLRSGISKALKV